MKRLISAITVKEANRAGKNEIIVGGKSTIITDEAADLAKKLGIKFVQTGTVSAESSSDLDKDTIKLIVQKTLERLPPEKRDMNTVSEAVLKVLKNYNK
jgi:hypothetical protein